MNEHEPAHPNGESPQSGPLPPRPLGNPNVDAGQNATDAVRTVSLDDAPRSETAEYAETNVSVIRDGIRRYGEPFLAYLILDGVEQRASDLVEQYEARYIGSFADRRNFAAWAIEDLGWNDDLIAFRRDQGMWPDDVKWDIEVLWHHLAQQYALTERLGGVHVFRA